MAVFSDETQITVEALFKDGFAAERIIKLTGLPAARVKAILADYEKRTSPKKRPKKQVKHGGR